MSSRQTFAQFAVPIFMLAVAAQQVVRVHTTLLNSNRGGGFGMFSTIDSSHLRFLRVQGYDARGRLVGSCGESIIPPAFIPALHEARWIPEPARLERLGRAVLGMPAKESSRLERALSQADAKPDARTFDHGCAFAERPQRVHLEMGSIEFDAQRHRVRAYAIAEHEVRR